MRLLVLGGTVFLGRHVVEAALGNGHEVTLANRGVTNPELFVETERIRVDLAGDLDPLADRTWDAVIDLDPTDLPRQTRRRAAALGTAVAHYLFVSTISVYADESRPPDESSPLRELPDPEPEEYSDEHYGGLKAASEQAVQEVFGARCAIVRPGLIAGPHDPTDRFTYWPRRLAEGGDVLAPGDPAAPVQLIDARDLGAWLVHVAESETSGIFNATGPAEPLTLGEALRRIAAVVGGTSRLVWVEEQRLLDAGVRPWSELPLWIPAGVADGLCRVDASRALAAGLHLRTLEDTARDTLGWSREAGEQRPTLSRETERELLAYA